MLVKATCLITVSLNSNICVGEIICVRGVQCCAAARVYYKV